MSLIGCGKGGRIFFAAAKGRLIALECFAQVLVSSAKGNGRLVTLATLFRFSPVGSSRLSVKPHLVDVNTEPAPGAQGWNHLHFCTKEPMTNIPQQRPSSTSQKQHSNFRWKMAKSPPCHWVRSHLGFAKPRVSPSTLIET